MDTAGAPSGHWTGARSSGPSATFMTSVPGDVILSRVVADVLQRAAHFGGPVID